MTSYMVFVLLLATVYAGPPPRLPPWHNSHHDSGDPKTNFYYGPRLKSCYETYGQHWDTFEVTYGAPGSGLGYYGMPWTVGEATAENKWEKIGEDRRLNVDIYSQHNDPRVMLLFDDNKNIAGVRLAFLKKDIKRQADEGGYEFEFDYENHPMYEKGNYWGLDLYHVSVLFTSPSKLAGGGRNVVLNKAKDHVAEGVFFKVDGQWIEMSKDECWPTPKFSPVLCYPGMGQHYFYKADEQNCSRRYPLFGLYDQGKLIGFGMGGFGSFSKNPDTKFYYEEFPPPTLKDPGFSRAIPCIGDYATKFGLTHMHVYLKKKAPEITCPPKDWRPQC